MSLTREQFFAIPNTAPEEVTLPDGKGVLFVRIMSGTERDAYEADVYKDRDSRLDNMRAKLVARTACDATGVLLFTLGDVVELGGKDWGVLQAVIDAAQRINSLSNKALEDIKGNSEPSPGAAQS